jgi:hypothetical protein
MFIYLFLDMRLKDATKVMGKKFSAGASISETASGAKEVSERLIKIIINLNLKILYMKHLCFTNNIIYVLFLFVIRL